MSGERIVRYTAAELAELRRTEGSRSDWAKVDAMTEEELQALIAEDPDEQGFPAEPTVPFEALVHLELPLALVRELPTTGPERDREISRIVENHLKRRAARARKAG